MRINITFEDEYVRYHKEKDELMSTVLYLLDS